MTKLCDHPQCSQPAAIGKRGPLSYCSDKCRVDANRARRGEKKLRPATGRNKPTSAKSSPSPLDNPPESKVDPHRLAEFMCQVAHKLAVTEMELRQNSDIDSYLKRQRCLNQIAAISRRPDVRLHCPQKAVKQAAYVDMHRPAVRQVLEAQKSRLQPELI